MNIIRVVSVLLLFGFAKCGGDTPQTSSIMIRGQVYNVVPVPPDGSCFYHAVALHVNHNVQQLRQMTADEIQNNPQRYHPTVDLNDLVQQIRNNRWADHIEIAALQRSLGRSIFVYNNRTSDVQTRGDINQEPIIYVFYNGRNHYSGLQVS